LPNLNDITRGLLDTIETKHSLFENDIKYARMVEHCIEALSTQEDLERVVKLLQPLSIHPDPDGNKLNARQLNNEKITGDSILNYSINCTRGIVGKSVMLVLNKLLELELKPLDSIVKIIERLAIDKAIEVRASLLRNLAYTAYKNKELGWHIFNIVFGSKQTYLWSLGEKFLYNQYYSSYDMVRPCLDRIKDEAITECGATWGRLSALCMIQGHFTQQDFFKELKQIDNKDVWDGALSVFIANLEKDYDGLCHESFRKSMKESKVAKKFGHKIDGAFKLDEGGKFINSATGQLFINSLVLDKEKNPKMNYFIDWIEYQSRIDPMIALELCESLLSKLLSFETKVRLWHSEPLISALTTILREADESDDLELINRAVHVQDQFLLMGIDGMDKYLEEAALL